MIFCQPIAGYPFLHHLATTNVQMHVGVVGGTGVTGTVAKLV